MNTTTTRKLAAAAAVTVATAAVAAALAAPASADTSTDGYLSQLHAMGYASGRAGDAGLVTAGLTACQELDAGYSVAYVGTQLWQANPSLTQWDAGYIEGAAISWLCPRHTNLLPSTGSSAA